MSEIDINQELHSRGLDFTIGLDTQRVWATGAQAFINPDFTLLVFRDQTIGLTEGTDEKGFSIKNVASVVMPTAVIRELVGICANQLTLLDAKTDAGE